MSVLRPSGEQGGGPSRPSDEGASIRRRRECLACHKRFTTYETMESLPLVVIKKDGSRQTFDKSKLLNGMIRACEKRPVPFGKLEEIANEIEQVLQNDMDREIPSAKIGELVMDRLREVDEVAYVRFASVYRQFTDINTFVSEIEKLQTNRKKKGVSKKDMGGLMRIAVDGPSAAGKSTIAKADCGKAGDRLCGHRSHVQSYRI